MAESTRLTVCWDCGAVEHHGVKGGVCIACMTLYTHNEKHEAT